MVVLMRPRSSAGAKFSQVDRLSISSCFSYPEQHRHVRPGCHAGDKGGDIMIGICESQTNVVVERNNIIEQVFFFVPKLCKCNINEDIFAAVLNRPNRLGSFVGHIWCVNILIFLTSTKWCNLHWVDCFLSQGLAVCYKVVCLNYVYGHWVGEIIRHSLQFCQSSFYNIFSTRLQGDFWA